MTAKVLIIEDSKVFSGVLKNQFWGKFGFICDIVHNYAEAQQTLEHQHDQYFVAIVDINLPDAPNGEATDLVVNHHIPAIIFTSLTNQSIKEDLWERGIADYALKSSSYCLEYISWVVNRIYRNINISVLVVDDSVVARNSLCKLLQRQRFNVFMAENGEQALDTLRQHPEIKVVTVDCFMEPMNGFDLCKKIRERHPIEILEIVGVSSQGSSSMSAEFIKSGATDFLNKPFSPEEVLCRINRAVDRIETYYHLQELNKQKNQLIGTAAHDIRGPIAGIKTATEFILNPQFDENKKQIMLSMVQKSSEHLLNLLEELLDASAIEGADIKLKIQSTDITELINDRLQLYQHTADEKGLFIELALVDKCVAEVDAVRLVQLIDNLLTNAIKYSPIDGSICVVLQTDASDLELRVEDTGPGIKQEELDELFAPYSKLSSQTTAGEKSTGLGLAIAKKVVQAHHGLISYEPSNLGGSCFKVTLPLSQEVHSSIN